MLSREWPILVGMSVFALTAIGCAIYSVTAGAGTGYAMPGGLLVLAAGQLVAVMANSWRAAMIEERVQFEAEDRRQLQDEFAAMASRMDTAERRLDNPPKSPLDGIAAEVKALRDGVAKLAQRPVPDAPPDMMAKPVRPAPAADRIELLLEPIIELSTGATAHYRAQLNLTNDSGTSVSHEALMFKADAGGMRDALDAHALKLTGPVLRKLRLRNPGMRIFVPLGGETLSSPAGMERLRNILSHDSDIARAIVFELSQDGLAGLDEQGIASLADLSRFGVTMGLANVSLAGLDLASLKRLGVKYLAINAASFDAGFGTAPAWREFSQYARAMQFQIIAAKVAAAPQATASVQLARYACGPFFAPPRKVKTDAGVQAAAAPARAA